MAATDNVDIVGVQQEIVEVSEPVIEQSIIKPDYWRQLDILNPKLLPPVMIIGAGGIGSPVALMLAKLGFSDITLIDDDDLEDHNIPNQIYRLKDCNSSKVDALKDIVMDFSNPEKVRVFNTRFKRNNKEEFFTGFSYHPIVISGVDSMQARADIWQALKYDTRVPIYIDGRMGGEVFKIFTINPCNSRDIEYYERNLHTDEEADVTPCTAQSIIYNVFTLTGMVGSQVKKVVKNMDYNKGIIFDHVTMSLILS